MIVTTTQSIEGRQIVEYRGIVFGEVITGINVLKDFAAGVRNFLADAPLLMKRNCWLPGSRRWMNWNSAPQKLAPTPWSVWTLTMKCWAQTMGC